MSSIITNLNSSNRMDVDQLDLNAFIISTITKEGKVPGETILSKTISGLTNNTEENKTMMSSLSIFVAEDTWFRHSNERRYCRRCCQLGHPNLKCSKRCSWCWGDHNITNWSMRLRCNICGWVKGPHACSAPKFSNAQVSSVWLLGPLCKGMQRKFANVPSNSIGNKFKQSVKRP